MSDGPDLATLHVADVAERTPVVSGTVFTPACDSDVLPAAVTTAGVGDHHVVAAVRQQLNLRRRRVRTAEDPHRRLWICGAGMGLGELRSMWVRPGRLGNTLLQQ